MNKQFSNILSGVAILISLIAISLSLTNQGPAGQIGSIGSQGPSGNPGQIGSIGSQGPSGNPGEDGSTPYIGDNGNWWIGETDSGVSASGANASQIPLPNVDLALSARETQLYNESLVIPFTTPEEKLTYAQNLIATQGFVGISTASQLINMTDIDGKYVLLNDITFAPNLLWSPINFNGTGSVDNYFSGILDGAGFFIANLHYESIDFSQAFSKFGLFEGLNEATVRHLYLNNFNIFSINNESRSEDEVGSLAGFAMSSDIYNINMTNTLVSGNIYIGGLIGLIVDSTVRFITATLIRVWGVSYVGGLFGIMINTELTNVNIKTILYGSNNSQGGVTGSSSNSFFAFIEVETELIPSNNPLVNIRIDIGGVIGSSSHDRLFRVTSTGMMEFIPIDTNFFLINVGGVIGFGNNVVLAYVKNQTNITIFMDEIDYDVAIQSIGGLMGSVNYGTLYNVWNSGLVAIYPPENGLDTGVYLYAEETPVEYIGGIIGYVYGSVNLKYLVNTGLVVGIVEVGGIIGSTGGGGPISNLQQLIVIDQGANLGSVGGYAKVGGLMGVSDVRTNLIVANFMNYGNINANYIVGGLFGMIAPVQGIKVQIINAYNRGVVTALDYGVGGLIGRVAPELPNFEFPVLGELHMYNSFNVGLVRTLNLGKANTDFQDFAGGSIIGFRYILTYMYGVSYTPQVTSYEETTYEIDTYIETGKIIDIDLPGVGNGNNTDMNMIHNPQYLFNPDLFIYRTAWNFSTIWAADDNQLDGLPYLQFLYTLL